MALKQTLRVNRENGVVHVAIVSRTEHTLKPLLSSPEEDSPI
jgi:hypothetical protein